MLELFIYQYMVVPRAGPAFLLHCSGQACLRLASRTNVVAGYARYRDGGPGYVSIGQYLHTDSISSFLPWLQGFPSLISGV